MLANIAVFYIFINDTDTGITQEYIHSDVHFMLPSIAFIVMQKPWKNLYNLPYLKVTVCLC